MAKSLYEIKLEEKKRKNKNIITDMDYFLRDKKVEKGKNTFNMAGEDAPVKAKSSNVKASE
jgi:hypothetical protein